MSQRNSPAALRVATYNIHKGVQGLGPARRLEIHNLALAVEMLDADIVCLQEVRRFSRREADRFVRWPNVPQADYLAPEGYQAVYATNAYTRHGEHGNALLSRWPVVRHRHEDMSDHRFEQRGLLHAEVRVDQQLLHVIVVHFGLIPASRRRQTEQVRHYIQREIAPAEPLLVAGDFNDWGSRVRRTLGQDALCAFEGARTLTYPSRLPVAQLDHIYARGLRPLSLMAPRGRIWSRMSDHLPLIAEFQMT
ncbi:MAG: endonuclease/exonuclease/phosphatase family protein [Burkholderiaceae bacterium]|jgi:endonuclease/exonuclease/phosphatase family metal-dependent hydrolase|nr:endonuclease/exonuclease/phosphatase family protein [Burkholderiaceae bacterium]